MVLPDDRILNQEIVRTGVAWWYRKYVPENSTLARFEKKARENRDGLWAEPNPRTALGMAPR